MRFSEIIEETIINELLDSNIPYKWIKNSPTEVKAKFKIGPSMFNKHIYMFEGVQYQNNTWKVSFYMVENGKKNYDITGTGYATYVIATIRNIMVDFMSSMEIDKLIFSSEGKSRTSLYTRMVKSLLPDWNIKIDPAGNTTFFYATKPSSD